mmetsp:Transcript_23964/g.59736  ORF Transcript_23964/g.59736 Transcript_23964/m.59736 type:complete len:204 (-) Transcript_23964:557-1168(-)
MPDLPHHRPRIREAWAHASLHSIWFATEPLAHQRKALGRSLNAGRVCKDLAWQQLAIPEHARVDVLGAANPAEVDLAAVAWVNLKMGAESVILATEQGVRLHRLIAAENYTGALDARHRSWKTKPLFCQGGPGAQAQADTVGFNCFTVNYHPGDLLQAVAHRLCDHILGSPDPDLRSTTHSCVHELGAELLGSHLRPAVGVHQ